MEQTFRESFSYKIQTPKAANVSINSKKNTAESENIKSWKCVFFPFYL